MGRSSRYLPVFSLLFLLAGCRGLVQGNLPPAPDPPNPVTKRVYLIMLENQKLSAIIGNPAAPNLNALAGQYAYAANFFADTHPSIGNYFMLTTGKIITNNLDFGGIVYDNNLARVFGQNHISWRAYLQGIPSVGYLGDAAYPYAKTHDPFAYFSDAHFFQSEDDLLVPYTQFASDLNNDALPSFVYIAPDQLHNMHDCPAGGRNCDNNTKVQGVDAWLGQQIQMILASPAYQNHPSLIIIDWDESWDNDSQHGGGHIPVILIGQKVKRGFVSQTFFQHESMLRLISEFLSAPNMLGAAQTAPSMDEFLTP